MGLVVGVSRQVASLTACQEKKKKKGGREVALGVFKMKIGPRISPGLAG